MSPDFEKCLQELQYGIASHRLDTTDSTLAAVVTGPMTAKQSAIAALTSRASFLSLIPPMATNGISGGIKCYFGNKIPMLLTTRK